MSAVIEDIFKRFQEGAFKAYSEHGARDEEAQQRNRIRGFQRFKFAEKLNLRMFVPKELVMEFNPATGVADETYNTGNKFRPPLSFSSSAKLVKRIVHANPQGKKALISRAGLPEGHEWDTSDAENLNDNDMRILGTYAAVRIFTETVVTVNNEKITGQDFGIQYKISIIRDEFDNIVGTEYVDGKPDGIIPFVSSIAAIYSNRNAKEAKFVKDLREAKDTNWRTKYTPTDPEILNFDIVNLNEQDFKDNVLAKIYRGGLISEEFPVNYYIAYAFEMDNATGLIKGAENLAAMTQGQLESNMYLVKASKKIREALETFKFGKANAVLDKNIDFYELSVTGPEHVADGSNKNALVAQGTTFGVPAISIRQVINPQDPESKGYPKEFRDNVQKLIAASQDSMENIETRFKYSTRTRPINEDLEEAVIDEFVKENLLLNRSEFLPDATLKFHKSVFIRCYGEAAEDFFEDLELGVSDKQIDGEISKEEIDAGRKDFRDLNMEEEESDGVSTEEQEAADDAALESVATTTSNSMTERAEPKVIELEM